MPDVEMAQPHPLAAGAVRSTALIGVGAAFTLGAGVVTAKAVALLVGPSGLGVLALMQSAVNLGAVIGGLGLGVSVMQSTAVLTRTGENTGRVIWPGLAVGAFGGFLVGGSMLILQQPLAGLLFGNGHVGSLNLLAPAVTLSIVATVLTAYLTGLHDVRAVTAVNVITAVVAAGVGIGAVWALGMEGLALAILLSAITHAAVASAAIWHVSRSHARPSWDRWRAIAGDLVRSAPPLTGSHLASTGSQVLLPVVVVQFVVAADVGLFRAATAISVGYLTFFLAGLSHDYLPRVSRTSPDRHSHLMERRMRLVVGVGLPIILLLFAVPLLLLEVLYSMEFREASSVLRWLLIGDLLRLPSWVVAFTLLGGGSKKSYLVAEVAGGMLLLSLVALGAAWAGIEGAAVGYAAAQLLYFVLVWALLRRRVRTSPGRLQVVAVITAIVCAVLMWAGLEEHVVSLASGGLAIVAALAAWPRIYRLHRMGQL